MVVEGKETNGGGAVGVGSNCEAVNVSAIVLESDGVRYGNCTLGEGLWTYKRRKYSKRNNSEPRLILDEKVFVHANNQATNKNTEQPSEMVLQNSSCDISLARMGSNALMNGSDDCSLKHQRNIVLEQICLQLGVNEGSLQEHITDALLFHPENSCPTVVKECVHSHGDRPKCPLQRGSIHNGIQNAAKGNLGVMANGSSHHTITELCQRTFLDVILSENFSQLSNLLLENFRGMKVDNFIDISLVNSRMKEGAYKSSPMLFHSDIQQVWSKVIKVGTEMVALAMSLSNLSRISYREQVGGSVHYNSEEGKREFLLQESDVHAKLEETGASGVFRVCTCRCCGEKAGGRHCLVCDSCEEMDHVSCIEPAVEEIPLKTWYCSKCTAKGIEPPHEHCVLCERINGPGSSINGDGVDEVLTNEEALLDLEDGSNGQVEDGIQVLRGFRYLPNCNICRIDIENGEKVKKCDQKFCDYRYYHLRCLTREQLTYGPPWYCPSCLCRACLRNQYHGKAILCDGCDAAYHLYCMKPPRTSIPNYKRWFCTKCEVGIQQIQKAKRAYENTQNKLGRRAEEGQGPHKNLDNKQKEQRVEPLDKSGGVDMLLNAAKTLEQRGIFGCNGH